MIRVVLFDFGGVLAEEGYREGLEAVARRNALDPGAFFALAARLIYETGHIVGRCDEKTYVDALTAASGIRETRGELRQLLLDGFTLRPAMIALADRLRARGLVTGILSDQTGWLDEIDARDGRFRHFDHVFNSYHIGMAKDDPRTFAEVCRRIGAPPAETAFVDDNPGNVERAAAEGLRAIRYTTFAGCVRDLRAAGLPVDDGG